MESIADKLEERIEDLEKKYEEESFPLRFDRHYSKVVEEANELAEEIRQTASGDVDEDHIEIIKNFSDILIELLEIIEEKIEDGHSENEEIFEAISRDFYRNYKFRDISTPLILHTENIDNGTAHPIIEIEISDDDITFDRDTSLPVFQLSQEWVDNPEQWILSLHEFSHIAYPSSKHLEEPEAPYTHMSELFSDMLATHIAGPSYIRALLSHFSGQEDLNGFTDEHPSPSLRLKACEDIIREHRNEPEISEDIEDFFQKVNEWKEENSMNHVLSRKKTTPLRMVEDTFSDFVQENDGFKDRFVRVRDENIHDSPIDIVSMLALNLTANNPIDSEEAVQKIKSWYEVNR